MLKSWKFWLVNVALFALFALFAVGFRYDPKLVPSPLVGKKAPPFSVVEMQSGEKLDLDTLQGTPFLLNFWASWCVACRTEAKVLEAAHRRYGKDPKVFRVIGIAVQDKQEAALAFARRFGKTYYLGLDSVAGDIALNYGLYGVPKSFFVDAEGVIQYKSIGPVTDELIEKKVPPLLKGSGQNGQ